MKKAVFWDERSCGFCGRTSFYFANPCDSDDGGDTFLRNIVLSRATLHNIPEDGIVQ
jgi:hypothetical protein